MTEPKHEVFVLLLIVFPVFYLVFAVTARLLPREGDRHATRSSRTGGR